MTPASKNQNNVVKEANTSINHFRKFCMTPASKNQNNVVKEANTSINHFRKFCMECEVI